MLDLIHAFNLLLSVAVTAAFAYQGAFMLVGFLNRRRAEQYDAPPARELRRYAALIAARNEEAVIAELIESLRAQDYPADKLDIFVVADNCTDATAAVARQAGAQVFERFDTARVGKGYALDFLFCRLREAGLEQDYAGYFVFDADNLVDRAFCAAYERYCLQRRFRRRHLLPQLQKLRRQLDQRRLFPVVSAGGAVPEFPTDASGYQLHGVWHRISHLG